MARYLTQQPWTLEGLFGTIDAGDRDLPFEVGQVHKMPVRDATENWVVAAIQPSQGRGSRRSSCSRWPARTRLLLRGHLETLAHRTIFSLVSRGRGLRDELGVRCAQPGLRLASGQPH